MFVLVCIMLVLFPSRSADGAYEGMSLAVKALPSLLPFAVFSGCIIFSGLARVFGAALSGIFGRLFNVSPYGAAAFVTGLLGGYPTGVKAVCDTLGEGLIDKDEAERLLGFCNNSGIVFIVQTVGAAAFGDAKDGLILYIIHIAAAVAAGVIMRGKGKSYGKMKVREEYDYYRKQRPPAMYVMGKSLASAGGAMVNVCAAIIVFNAVIAAFSLDSGWLCGIAEMTKGVFYAGGRKAYAAASFFLSWGGLSVHAQASAIASGYDISLKRHFFGKLMSACIAGALAAVVFR